METELMPDHPTPREQLLAELRQLQERKAKRTVALRTDTDIIIDALILLLERLEP